MAKIRQFWFVRIVLLLIDAGVGVPALVGEVDGGGFVCIVLLLIDAGVGVPALVGEVGGRGFVCIVLLLIDVGVGRILVVVATSLFQLMSS
ncbi:MAG: hypothetical protein Q4D73_07360, partial [Actinomycetaceae bacterium]|nr:hypothetical protein [Actinomycetaceae bacterium]